jgi:hypothetical protein
MHMFWESKVTIAIALCWLSFLAVSLIVTLFMSRGRHPEERQKQRKRKRRERATC